MLAQAYHTDQAPLPPSVTAPGTDISGPAGQPAAPTVQLARNDCVPAVFCALKADILQLGPLSGQTDMWLTGLRASSRINQLKSERGVRLPCGMSLFSGEIDTRNSKYKKAPGAATEKTQSTELLASGPEFKLQDPHVAERIGSCSLSSGPCVSQPSGMDWERTLL